MGRIRQSGRLKTREQRKNLAHAAHSLLGQFHRLPGTNKEGKVNVDELLAWIEEVRSLCAEYGRAEIGDQYIGQLLSTSRDEERGIWPCNAVCEVMEEIASEELARGFVIGVRNARGAHWRDKGGYSGKGTCSEVSHLRRKTRNRISIR